MVGCDRTSKDPLLRILLDDYGVHLLNRPHQDIRPGQLLMWQTENLHYFAKFEDVFGSNSNIPFKYTDREFYKTLASIYSSDVSTGISGKMTTLLAAMCGILPARVSAALKRASAKDIRIALSGPRWLYLDIAPTHMAINAQNNLSPNDAYAGWKIYLVTSVYLSRGVRFLFDKNIAAEVAAQLQCEAESAEVNLELESVANRELKWSLPSDEAAIFGVSFVELCKEEGKWVLHGVDHVMRVRGSSAKLDHAFVGDADTGSLFLNLS
ncbi:MAG: hypothetical protein EP335_06955 [Alphaproteobacteria bacterium]|nr:MAG: hypothetical protein EP335_06955 [Alphaproteobacteria bacterium]